MADFQSKIEKLVDRTVDNNRWRQRECINLIPSESSPSCARYQTRLAVMPNTGP